MRVGEVRGSVPCSFPKWVKCEARVGGVGNIIMRTGNHRQRDLEWWCHWWLQSNRW